MKVAGCLVYVFRRLPDGRDAQVCGFDTAEVPRIMASMDVKPGSGGLWLSIPLSADLRIEAKPYVETRKVSLVRKVFAWYTLRRQLRRLHHVQKAAKD